MLHRTERKPISSGPFLCPGLALHLCGGMAVYLIIGGHETCSLRLLENIYESNGKNESIFYQAIMFRKTYSLLLPALQKKKKTQNAA